MKEELSRTQRQTRQNLIGAFMALYAEKPIEKISIGEVTKAAGYSRSTFYLYFTDIYALSDAAREDLLSEIREKVLSLLEEDSRGPMPGLLRKMGGLAYEYADRMLLFANEPAFRDSFTSIIAPVLAKRSGLDPASKEYRFVVYLIVSMMLSNVEFWHRNMDSYTLEEIIAMAQTILVPGMLDFAKIV